MSGRHSVRPMPDDREPIQWGGENEEDFDSRYDHDWFKPQTWSDRRCKLCGMTEGQWTGDPCLAKAEHISYWVPRRDWQP